MAIESTPDGSVIITGAADTRTYALVTLASALALEMTTGLKASRHTNLTAVARAHGVIPDDGTKPQKKKILKLTVQKIREAWPAYEPSTNVAKALVK